MKVAYKQICKEIRKKALKEKIDYRELVREWIMFFEKQKVDGWNRMVFLECMEREIDNHPSLNLLIKHEQGEGEEMANVSNSVNLPVHNQLEKKE